MRRSLLNPILAFGVLIIIIIGFSFVGNTIEGYFPVQKPEEISSMPIGDTVVNGMKVIDNDKIRKVPIIYHFNYLNSLLNEDKYLQVLNGILTGSVETPLLKIAGSYISPQGIAQGFEGPGFVSVEGQQLVVKPPGTFVWGYKTGYTIGIKKKEGIEIKEGGTSGTAVKVVSISEINNETIPHNYANSETIKEWYNSSDEGDIIYLDYSLSNFNDGRNMVPPEKIQTFFGDNTLTYMKNYPGGSPVMAYMGPHEEKSIASTGESIGSYPEYGDAARGYNAMSFSKAWNGTIVPPGSSSHGKLNVYFEGVYDPNATGNYAVHGVCPAARSMRNAIGAAGLPTPSGIKWDHLSIAYGVSPTGDVSVYNNKNYPIKIVMWTQGSGAGTVVYTKIVKLN
jgi:hypothetical protein